MSAPSAQRSLNLLSLDGGGVRGLSALYILKRMMAVANERTELPLKPCDYFDLIGGTSTGGIIAIMLGRLKMDVDECIDVYLELVDRIFSKIHTLPVSLMGKTKERYSSSELESAIEQILQKKGLSSHTLLKDDDPHASKVFVCAKRQHEDIPVIFTTYKTQRADEDLLNAATILQACRATSAAPTYFDPLEIRLGPSGAQYTDVFVDGGLGDNNPVGELWTQTEYIWPGAAARSGIECLVSIGTGKPSVPNYGTGAVDLGKRLLHVATESERSARRFYDHHRHDLGRQRYYRFNVDRGLEDVELGEAKEKARIIRVTKDYMNDGEVHEKVQDCTERLASREWIKSCVDALISLRQSCSSEVSNRISKFNFHRLPEEQAWLSNTIEFWKFMSSPPNDPISTDWLCHPRRGSLDKIAMTAALFESLGRQVILYDCSQDPSQTESAGARTVDVAPSLTDLTSHTKGIDRVSTKIMGFFWSLISQVISSETVDLADAATKFFKETWSQNQATSLRTATPQAVKDTMRKLLQLAFRHAHTPLVVLLHNAEVLTSETLEDIKESLQHVIRSQKDPQIDRLKIFILCDNQSEGIKAFAGIPTVDEDTEYQGCLRSLEFISMNRRRDAIHKRDLGDSHWLWNHPAYLNWFNQSRGIFWLHGSPGSGKSVVAHAIRRHFRTASAHAHQGFIVCEWYYSARESLISHRQMLQAILFQILKQERRTFDALKHLYRQNVRSAQVWTDEWTCDRLRSALLRANEWVHNKQPLLYILDGVDESRSESSIDDLSRDEMLNVIQEISKRSRVLISSRHHADIRRKILSGHMIALQDENESDIEKVIAEGLIELSRRLNRDGQSEEIDEEYEPYCQEAMSFSQDMLSEVKDYLSCNARGIMLWIVTVMSALEFMVDADPTLTMDDIRRVITSTPSGVEKLYESIVADILNGSPRSIHDSRRALAWVNVATSKEDLTLRDLREAMRIPELLDDTGKYPFKHLVGVGDAPSFYRFVQRLCGSLVEVVKTTRYKSRNIWTRVSSFQWDDKIQLVHQTVKVFLEASAAAGPLQITFKDAVDLVAKESEMYLRLALPSVPTEGAPLPLPRPYPCSEIIDTILRYLQQKSLVSRILQWQPSLIDIIPEYYRCIFEYTANNSINDPENPPAGVISEYGLPFWVPTEHRSVSAIILQYFLKGSERGLEAAVSNLFAITRYADGSSIDYGHYQRVAVFYAALNVAIRHGLENLVEHLVNKAEEMRVEILTMTTRSPDGQLELPHLMQLALRNGKYGIARTLAGYMDDQNQGLLAYGILRLIFQTYCTIYPTQLHDNMEISFEEASMTLNLPDDDIKRILISSRPQAANRMAVSRALERLVEYLCSNGNSGQSFVPLSPDRCLLGLTSNIEQWNSAHDFGTKINPVEAAKARDVMFVPFIFAPGFTPDDYLKPRMPYRVVPQIRTQWHSHLHIDNKLKKRRDANNGNETYSSYITDPVGHESDELFERAKWMVRRGYMNHEMIDLLRESLRLGQPPSEESGKQKPSAPEAYGAQVPIPDHLHVHPPVFEAFTPDDTNKRPREARLFNYIDIWRSHQSARFRELREDQRRVRAKDPTFELFRLYDQREKERAGMINFVTGQENTPCDRVTTTADFSDKKIENMDLSP